MQELKIGGWVRANGSIFKIKEFSQKTSRIITEDDAIIYKEECVPWEPKTGELCKFTKGDQEPVVAKFLYYQEGIDGLNVSAYYTEESNTNYDFCEPLVTN